MKKWIMLVICILLCLTMVGCWVDVGPGQAAIRVNKFGNERGVEPKPLMTGRVSYGYGQEIIIYPITEQTWAYSATSGDGSDDNQEFTANSKDSLPISFDVQITFHIDPMKLPKFYTKYATDLDSFKNGFLRNSVRQAFTSEFSKLTVEQIMGSEIPSIGKNVCNNLNEEYKIYGVVFTSVGIVNSPRPPGEVKKSIALKVAAAQNALAAKSKVDEAELLKQANQKTADSLTPLLVQKMWIEKMNPNVQVIYIPSGSNLMMSGLPTTK